MKLMTKELEQRFKTVGRQDVPDPLVVAKYFNPVGSATWWATEYDSETNECFGFVSLFGSGGRDDCAELGSFSLDELGSLRLPLGISIERDLYWTERPMSQVREIAIAKGEVTP